jgi:hypothetical protein
MDGQAFPKPKKADRTQRKKLDQNDKTKARKRLYRLLVRPAYMTGLATGQGRRGEQPLCERCDTNVALHIHHMAGRDGELVIDYTKIAAVCPDCHGWIHANPSAARASGWLLSRNGPRDAGAEKRGPFRPRGSVR